MSTPPESERPKTAASPATTTPPAPPKTAPPAPGTPAPEVDRPSTWQPILWVRLAVLLVIVAYVIAFVVENTDEITIDFVFTTAKVHLIWEMLLLLVCGVVGGVLLSQLYRRSARAELRQKRPKPGDTGRDVGRRDEAVRKSG